LESQDFKLAEKVKFQAIKGVRDILPPESALWNRVEQTAREVFGRFGFAEIRLPVLEQVELFARSIGEETDVVTKEMYSFEDHDFLEFDQIRDALIGTSLTVEDTRAFQGYERNVLAFADKLSESFKRGDVPKTPENERVLRSIPEILERMNRCSAMNLENPSSSQAEEAFAQCLTGVKTSLRSFRLGDTLALRPEATASVVRAYIEHGMQVLPGSAKLYYMGPMFRRERPQKGRYRQFYQIGAEVLGSSDAPGIDAELIEMLMRLFERLKLKGAVLHLNSIGCKNCRPKYVEKLRAELQKVREQLGPDSQRRIETNPLRVLDSKLESEQAIIEKLPRIAEHLCADCREHYDEVKRQLGMRGIAYQENWRLVRGLDYYMRTTFEITAPGLGSHLVRRMRFAAAGAMMVLWNCSVVRPRQKGSGSPSGPTGWCSRCRKRERVRRRAGLPARQLDLTCILRGLERRRRPRRLALRGGCAKRVSLSSCQQLR
jgi:ATP phosphoribosyltransferase regulatory subunit HisZ